MKTFALLAVSFLATFTSFSTVLGLPLSPDLPQSRLSTRAPPHTSLCLLDGRSALQARSILAPRVQDVEEDKGHGCGQPTDSDEADDDSNSGPKLADRTRRDSISHAHSSDSKRYSSKSHHSSPQDHYKSAVSGIKSNKEPGHHSSEKKNSSFQSKSSLAGSHVSAKNTLHHASEKNYLSEGSHHTSAKNSLSEISHHTSAKNTLSEVSHHTSEKTLMSEGSHRVSVKETLSEGRHHASVKNASSEGNRHATVQSTSSEGSHHATAKDSLSEGSRHTSASNTLINGESAANAAENTRVAVSNTASTVNDPASVIDNPDIPENNLEHEVNKPIVPVEEPGNVGHDTYTGGLSGGYQGKATFFLQGGSPGACGRVHEDSDFIVAIQTEMYTSGKFCGKTVMVTRKSTGKTIMAIAADECPGCPSGQSLDLSVGAFNALGKPEEGIFDIEWAVLN